MHIMDNTSIYTEDFMQFCTIEVIPNGSSAYLVHTKSFRAVTAVCDRSSADPVIVFLLENNMSWSISAKQQILSAQVPGHKGLEGNEKAAKAGMSQQLGLVTMTLRMQ